MDGSRRGSAVERAEPVPDETAVWLAAATPDAVACFDRGLRCHYRNQAAAELLDGRTLDRPLAAAAERVLARNEPARVEFGVDRRYDAWVLPKPGPDRTPTGIVLVARDVTARTRELRALANRLEHDRLTGLLDKTAFEARLARALRQPPAGGYLALVLLDLDHLKYLNDGFGHQTGDAALRAVSSQLIAAAGPGDLLGRLGGDEFGWLATGADESTVARRVRAALRAIGATQVGGAGQLSASAGLANAVVGSRDAVLARADAALYEAKAAGRGVLRIAGQAATSTARRRTDAGAEQPTPIAAVDLARARTVEEVCRATLPEWVGAFSAAGAGVALRGCDDRTMTTAAWYRFGRHDPAPAHAEYRLGADTAGALWRGLPCDGQATDPELRALLAARGFGSIMLVPLRLGALRLGVVEVVDARPRTHTTSERRCALALADHLAALLVNADTNSVPRQSAGAS